MVLAAMALVGVACENPGPWVGAGPRVAVVGDSLVLHAENPLTNDDPDDVEHEIVDDLVAAGYTASVGAHVGHSIPETVELVEMVPEPGAEILVFAAGTNDAHSALDVETQMAPLRDLLDRTSASCVVLVTVTESSVPWDLVTEAPPYNAALHAEADTRADVLIADWVPIAAAHPEYFLYDGAHMTLEGREAYRDLILAGADACAATVPAPAPTPTTVESSTTTTQSTTTTEAP